MKRIISVALVLICILACNTSHALAFYNMEDRDIILNTAFNGKTPMVDYDFKVEPIKTEVVFDSRYDSPSLSVLTPKGIPSKYDYYKTYHTGFTCSAAGYPTLDVNISFYVNVFFKLDSNFNSKCIGYENPVIQSVSNPLGAQGYSDAKVVVTSYTSNKINFKGTCTLVAGLTLKMSGKKSISLP